MIRRPLEDKARRRIAYLLIALLALVIVALLAGVVFGVIPVSEIEGVRRDPRPARGAGIGGHRLLLRIQAVADSGAADRGFRILDDLLHDGPETSLLRFTSPRGAAVEVDTAAPAAIPDDDTPAVTVDPHDLTLLKGHRKGVLFERRPGVTLPADCTPGDGRFASTARAPDLPSESTCDAIPCRKVSRGLASACTRFRLAGVHWPQKGPIYRRVLGL